MLYIYADGVLYTWNEATDPFHTVRDRDGNLVSDEIVSNSESIRIYGQREWNRRFGIPEPST